MQLYTENLYSIEKKSFGKMSKAEIKRKQNSEHNREKKIPRKNENDSKTDSDFSDDQIDPSKDVVFNMPKPGPHAKVENFYLFNFFNLSNKGWRMA